MALCGGKKCDFFTVTAGNIAVVSQPKNCPLELIQRLSSKIRQLHPTIPVHLLVEACPLDAVIFGCGYTFQFNRTYQLQMGEFLGLCHYCIQ